MPRLLGLADSEEIGGLDTEHSRLLSLAEYLEVSKVIHTLKLI